MAANFAKLPELLRGKGSPPLEWPPRRFPIASVSNCHASLKQAMTGLASLRYSPAGEAAMLLVLIVYFILSLVIGSAASQRGRSAFGWFLVSILTTPLLAGVFLLLFPSLNDPTSVDDKALQEAIRRGRPVAPPQKLGVGGLTVSLTILLSTIIAAIVWNGNIIHFINELTVPSTNNAPTIISSPLQEQTLVPRGSEKPSFDCAKAKTAAARLICADAELARLDAELGVAFQKRKAQVAASDQPQFIAGQLAWIKNRNERCGLVGKSDAATEVLANSKPCMVSLVRERIAILGQTDLAAADKCAKYGPAVVTLNGVVNVVQAYGPPNYGEDPAHDAKEPFHKLTVRTPICVAQGKDEFEPGVSEAAEFQLALGVSLASPQSFPSQLLGKPVTIRGKLFHSETGHHHTEVLIDVTSIVLNEVAAGSQSSEGAVMPQQDAPKIKQGMPYNVARAIILSTGWRASIFKKTILNEIDRDLQEWFLHAGFMEVEECSGTGDDFCVAEFHDPEGKRKLYVFTTSGSRDEIKYIGHDPQIVSFCIDKKTVNCEQPFDANQVAALLNKQDRAAAPSSVGSSPAVASGEAPKSAGPSAPQTDHSLIQKHVATEMLRSVEALAKEKLGGPRTFDEAKATKTVEAVKTTLRSCVRSSHAEPYQQGIVGSEQVADFFLRTCGVPLIPILQNAGAPEGFARSLLTLVILEELWPDDYQKGMMLFERAAERANQR